MFTPTRDASTQFNFGPTMKRYYSKSLSLHSVCPHSKTPYTSGPYSKDCDSYCSLEIVIQGRLVAERRFQACNGNTGSHIQLRQRPPSQVESSGVRTLYVSRSTNSVSVLGKRGILTHSGLLAHLLEVPCKCSTPRVQTICTPCIHVLRVTTVIRVRRRLNIHVTVE